MTSSSAEILAQWAKNLSPTADDLELAERSLRDIVAVMLAARSEPLVEMTAHFEDGPRWAVAGHVLDYDDLHVPSTTHVSVVCIPTVLSVGGDARAYLAAAGVMARLGTALGWSHYAAGWHATCTAGAPAAAVGACVAWGLDADQIASAISLAIPAAGGLQQSFGTDAKALQVGFAVDAGLRAAELAAQGARADTSSLDVWIRLVGGDPKALVLSGDAVPGGLATKLYPCCYALQRPISVVAGLAADLKDWRDIVRVVVRTPASCVAPLIHHRPATALEAKFSLEYAVATALLDSHQGLDCFTDAAVLRDEARELLELVHLEVEPGGTDLLSGTLNADVEIDDGTVLSATLSSPPGSPRRPATAHELGAKFADCTKGLGLDSSEWTWDHVSAVLNEHIPRRGSLFRGTP